MDRLVYTEEELLAGDEYASLQEEAGYRLHGGFGPDGAYISPRTKYRWPAVRAWQAEVERRGWPLLDATTELLKRENYPNFEQQRLLLTHGLGRTLWNSLTITGIVEGRGRMLAEYEPPDLQEIVEEDLEATAAGHLGKGLLKAHGWDEGGIEGIGAHDTMWFAARDMVFGKDAYPLPEPPESLSRPETGRLMPQVPGGYEQLLLMLMNVLLIEIRAEAGFQFNLRLMRSQEVFTERREEAARAAVLVERIRQDERIHVGYLRVVLSELREMTFHGVDGASVKGAIFMDPIWEGLKVYHGKTIFEQRRERIRDGIVAALRDLPGGDALVTEFDQLERPEAA